MTSDDLKNYKRGRAPGAARQLSRPIASCRCRRRPPAAWCCSRCSTCWKASSSRPTIRHSTHLMVEAMRYAYADRAHLLGDPDFVKAPIAGLMSKRYAATLRAQHRPPARDAVGQDQGRRPGGLRRQQHHALFGGRPLRQRGRQHLHAQSQLRRRPDRRGHRRAAQQRARRFRRRARRAERLRAGRLRGQRAGPEQAAAVVDDADHRAARTASRSSSPARRAAAASSPRCCRCCST